MRAARLPLSPVRALLAVALALVVVVVGGGAAGCGPAASVAPTRYPALPKPSQGATHIIVFNVGQADAMLILHGNKTLLVDAGVARDKRSRPAFRDIPRRLEALTGRRHLDYMVVTHYHADHIGSHATGRNASLGELGLWGLLADERVTIGTLIDRGFLTFGEKGATQRSYEASLPLWMQRSVQRRVAAKEGMLIDMGPGLRIEVVAVNGAGRLLEIHRKRPGFFDRYPPSENDYSIALKLTQGNFEMFTGGDLTGQDSVRRFGNTAQSYNDIESRVAERVGDVEVYRVDHHGSDHSSNPCFLKVLNPEVSIFSVGQNGYGHPALRVYEDLKRRGRTILTGGAARGVYYTVKRDIVFGDVEILVEPDGRFYHVDGTRYRSLSDEEERNRPDYAARCPEPPDAPASQPELREGGDADVAAAPATDHRKHRRARHGRRYYERDARPPEGRDARPPAPPADDQRERDRKAPPPPNDDDKGYDDTPGD